MSSLPQNFLGLEPEHSSYDSARFVVLPVPYDAATSYQSGARYGPSAIISASQHVETFDDELLASCYQAGIATLEVLQSERLMENATRTGERIMQAFRGMQQRYELVKDVRGRGLMIGIEFGPPTSFALKASWNLLETANKGLFCQLITIPLFKDHKILTQVAGHGSHTIKLLLAVGAGVTEGEFVNRAQAMSGVTGGAISDEAEATVRLVPDPTFDCTDVTGKVFDDANRNGYQDQNETGLAGVCGVASGLGCDGAGLAGACGVASVLAGADDASLMALISS